MRLCCGARQPQLLSSRGPSKRTDSGEEPPSLHLEKNPLTAAKTQHSQRDTKFCDCSRTVQYHHRSHSKYLRSGAGKATDKQQSFHELAPGLHILPSAYCRQIREYELSAFCSVFIPLVARKKQVASLNLAPAFHWDVNSAFYLRLGCIFNSLIPVKGSLLLALFYPN